MNQTFQSTQKSKNSLSFIRATAVFAGMLLVALMSQSHSQLPELISKNEFILGIVLCLIAIGVETWIWCLNKKAYKGKCTV